MEERKSYSKLLIAGCLTLIMTCQSCKKFVEIDVPITNTNAELVFKNDESAIAAVNNIYATMSNAGIANGITSMSLYPSLSADELNLFNHITDDGIIAYRENTLNSENVNTGNYWNSIYSNYLFYVNSAVEGLEESSSLSSNVKKQLLGEAKFLRAFGYFYLVNLYGPVPIVLTTDYRENSQIPRSTTEDVYAQIKSDLTDAILLLNSDYLSRVHMDPTVDRITPNKSTAKALLARVYLYTKNWVAAEKEATEVISMTDLYDTVPLSDVFLKNSREAIWQLQSVSNSQTNTSDAMEFLYTKTFFYGGRVYLRSSLVSAFEAGDRRREKWIDSVVEGGETFYLPAKYKLYEPLIPEEERTTIFRLAEQYLIRAEARLEQGNLEAALLDLNLIRTRAGLPIINNSSTDLLKNIIQERRVEFFTEWGHRWLDLKRYDLANEVLKPIKAGWQPTDQLYPIPMSELRINHYLENNQNPGY